MNKRYVWRPDGMKEDEGGSWMIVPDRLFHVCSALLDFLDGMTDGAPDADPRDIEAGRHAELLRDALHRAGFKP